MTRPAARLRQSLVTQARRCETREPNDVGPGASRRSTATPMRGAAPRSARGTPHELRSVEEQGFPDYIPRYVIMSSGIFRAGAWLKKQVL